MILNRKFAPWVLVDPSRLPIAGVSYEKVTHALRASDGKALVIVPVTQDEEDESGIIPVEVFKEALRAAKTARQDFLTFAVKAGRAALPDGRSWALVDAQYPGIAPLGRETENRAKKARITFNPEIFASLVQAAGASKTSITLEFKIDKEGVAQKTPVKVTTPGVITAIFMPMREMK